jgi:ATP-dependent helicase/nuclease subunit A
MVLDLAALYWRAVEAYTRRKQQQEALDFDDLEARASTLLEHPRVRARWQAELHAVLVDEFQDTNDEQRAIIYALTGFAPPPPDAPPLPNPPDPPQLFVVGDGKQSIYRFRGADVSVFRTVAADIQARGGQAVALNTSFRTHTALLEWINTIFHAIFARRGSLRPYEVPFELLQPHRSPPDYERCVELHCIGEAPEAPTRRDAEARILVARIAALCAGAAGNLVYDRTRNHWRPPDYGDIALLFQASTAFEYYEHALREAGIPYLTTAGRGYYGRKEVQDLIHLLAVLYDPTDELALVGILRSPLFALDDETILHLRFAEQPGLWEALMAEEPPGGSTAGNTDSAAARAFARATLHDLHTMRGRVTVVHLLREALARTGYLATISGLPDGERRRVNVEKLVDAARQSGIRELSAFSAYLEDLLKTEPREGEAPLESAGSVRLMTVHRSKGLEFPIVVLPDLGRRSLRQQPLWLARRDYGLALRLRDHVGETQQSIAYQLALRAEQRMEQAERERLLYVALTRASDYLLLSGPPRTTTGDDWGSRIVAALGMPWEDGGPETGIYGEMQVRRV